MNQPKEPELRECQWVDCDELFQPEHHLQIYCCQQCKLEAKRARKMKHYYSNREAINAKRSVSLTENLEQEKQRIYAARRLRKHRAIAAEIRKAFAPTEQQSEPEKEPEES